MTDVPPNRKSGPPTLLNAVLQGKLGMVKRSEDFTTAMVFGLLAWLPVQVGLCPVLECVEPRIEGLGAITHADIELWPWWNRDETVKGAEPDVVITLHRANELPPLLVVVEAKRGAPLGHEQLLRQARNALAVANEHHRRADLIYLTEFLGQPPDYTAECAAMPSGVTLRWLSWRDLPAIFERIASAESDVSPMLRAMAADTAACLVRWGLVRFTGLHVPTPVSGWSFPTPNPQEAR